MNNPRRERGLFEDFGWFDLSERTGVSLHAPVGVSGRGGYSHIAWTDADFDGLLVLGREFKIFAPHIVLRTSENLENGGSLFQRPLDIELGDLRCVVLCHSVMRLLC